MKKIKDKSKMYMILGISFLVLAVQGPVSYTHLDVYKRQIKGVAIARGFVAPSGKNLVCTPAFIDINIDGEERTAIKLIVEAK